MLLLLFVFRFAEAADTENDSINRGRMNQVLLAEGVLYGGSLVGLNALWYSNYERSSFHFFNDNAEWLLIDKAGHAVTGYNLAWLSSDVYRWAGMSQNKAAVYGGLTGFAYLTVIEIMDGFSEKWGASPGDLAFNTLGAGLFTAQELIWQQQKIQLKWSFHLTDYADKRPNVLGSNLPERMLKDYNGQTIWLSVNPASFARESIFPAWLNLAFGYSANGMLGGKTNPAAWQDINRYRQFFFSADIDWRRIPTNSALLSFIFKTFSFVKLPFPAISFSEQGTRFHPFYW